MKSRLRSALRKMNLGGYGYNTPSMSDSEYVKKDKQQLGEAKTAMDSSAGVVSAINPLVGAGVKLGSEGFQANQKNTSDENGFVKKDAGFARSFGYLTANPVAAYAKGFERLDDEDLNAGEKAAGLLLPGIATSEIDYQKSERAKTKQQQVISDYYKTSFSDYSKAKISSGEVNTQGNSGARMFKFGGKAEELAEAKTIGGKFSKLSNDSLQVEGKTHAEGGVKVPSEGVELEDGETVKGDFVFSDKLGFADVHKKLARQIGKTEKLPDNDRKANTLARLEEQEKLLMKKQEETKAALGMENDKDNIMEKGGKLRKMFGGGRRRGVEDTAFKYGANQADGNPDDEVGIGDERANSYTNTSSKPSLRTIEEKDYSSPLLTNPESGLGRTKSTSKFGKFASTTGGNLAELAPTIADSISGYSNANRRLNTPVEQISEIPKVKFGKVSADASLNDADRQRTALTKWSQNNLSDSNVVAANNASMLASTIAAKNAIQQDVNNKNVDIKNDEAVANQAIKEKNINNAFGNSRLKRLATDEAYQDMHDTTLNASRGFSQYTRDKKSDARGDKQSIIDASAKMTPEQFNNYLEELKKYKQGEYGGKFSKMEDGGNLPDGKGKKVFVQKNYSVDLDPNDIIGDKNAKYPRYGGESGKRKQAIHDAAMKAGDNYYTLNGVQDKPFLANPYDKMKKDASEDVLGKSKLRSLPLIDSNTEIEPLKESKFNLKDSPRKGFKDIMIEDDETKKKSRPHNSRTYSSGEGYYFIDKDNGRKVSSKSKLGLGLKRVFS